MAAKIIILTVSVTFMIIVDIEVEGHGMLMEPPNRSSLWRFPEFNKFNVTTNFDDNQLYCGGFGVQYLQNGGKCGPCGDNYAQKRPRDNETGGKYGKSIIVRNYTKGEVVPIRVDITTDHQGSFQFHLCPRNDPTLEEDECFKYSLPFADGTGYSRDVTVEELKIGYVNTTLTLPPNVRCPYCVLRWHYKTGNTWGTCENGTSATGCGPQEIFRSCADIAIN